MCLELFYSKNKETKSSEIVQDVVFDLICVQTSCRKAATRTYAIYFEVEISVDEPLVYTVDAGAFGQYQLHGQNLERKS